MSLSVPARASFVILGAMLVLSVCSLVSAATPAAEITRALAAEVGSFHQTQSPKPSDFVKTQGLFDDAAVNPKATTSSQAFEAEYASARGDKFTVRLARLQSDAEAYALLTLTARGIKRFESIKAGDIGTADFIDNSRVVFFQGPNFVSVTGEPRDVSQATDLARALSAQMDKGEDEIPVLAKHLPDAPRSLQNALYIVSDKTLRENVSGAPVLDVVTFDGGTEAVAANYGQAQLVIIEFTTPQFSIDNDSRIWTKIAELKSEGRPVPSAYRRVGNYSVFVFNAPDEQTANALIDQVKYEQVVQWLGDDPHLYERMQRYLTQTSAGVLVAVLKSSGLSLILCLGIGGLVGALLFRHRRAQRAAAFSDAGGGIRLNLDELTGPANTRRLLSSPKRSHEDPTS
ncbi:MAG TPA: DUF6599 family protein [Pyrinomonadaceae bacterium]|jgi:hypothetical protein|nr:DUF6599 family protein [Pyrinomonadaceae bacterium]